MQQRAIFVFNKIKCFANTYIYSELYGVCDGYETFHYWTTSVLFAVKKGKIAICQTLVFRPATIGPEPDMP